VIALDTNVLVRFLVEDDPEQAERVRRFLARAVKFKTPLFVTDIALCELVWVLSYSYKLSRREVADHLSEILRSRQLRFSSRDRCARALGSFRQGKADFPDYLMREVALDEGCSEVATFDGDCLLEPGFVSP